MKELSKGDLRAISGGYYYKRIFSNEDGIIMVRIYWKDEGEGR